MRIRAAIPIMKICLNNIIAWSKTILLLSLFVSSFSLAAQNIIPNPGFEYYEYLPSRLSSSGRDFEKASKHWTTPNEASTDLVNPRFNSKNLSTIPAHSGGNMAGIVINGDFWAEYAAVKLKKPIEPGITYYCEFWISMPPYYSRKKPIPTFLNDYFGFRFENETYKYSKEILKFKPQFSANEEILVEPTKWQKISGSFVAKEKATHLYIGQFLDEEQPEKLATGYFFIDDVFVEAFSSEAIRYAPSRYYKIEKGVASINMENIYFQTDKYDLLEESFPELNKLVDILEKNPTIRIQIQGHTDDEGDEKYNKTLSENRATAVREYILEKGIEENRLESIGLGLSNPVATNQSEEGRQANRRVEFVVQGGVQDTRKILDPEQIYRFADEVNPKLHAELAFLGKDSRSWDCSETFTESNLEPDARKRLEKYKPKDAKSFILDEAAKNKYLFINESNRFPQTRAFLQLMLGDLFDLGYRYLAVEAFNTDDDQLKTRGYPVMNSGYSLKEPVFGDLIREAIALGFIVFGYQPSPEEIGKAQKIVQARSNSTDEKLNEANALSWAQAMNLSRIIKADPDAKILVLAKEYSIREFSIEGRSDMATWFKSLTRSNPLTIDQCRMIERCPPENDPLYQKLMLDKATVYTRESDCFVQKTFDESSHERFKKCYDIQVFHPKHDYPNNRPAWLQMNGYRKPFVFNPDKHEMKYPCLVRAYKKGEDKNFAVPVDVVEVADPSIATSLMLPAGTYDLVMKDGNMAKQLEVVIE